MTNALAQNIQTDKNVALDLLTRAVNVSSSAENQTKETGFSNFLNNLDSRTQKAQKTFEKEAIVSNTSSINKKALDKKAPIKKETTENTSITENISKKATQKKPVDNVNVSNKNIKKDVKEPAIKSKDVQADTTVKINSEEKTQDLSDINNSSLVESSPVFSSDKNFEINEDVKAEIEKAIDEIGANVEELVKTIPVADGTSTIENQDIKTKIEDLIENLENVDEAIKVVDEISANLDNSNLNQDKQDKISSILEDTKKLLKDIQALLDEPTTFDEAMSELKDKVQSLMDGIMLEIGESISKGEISNVDLSQTIVNENDVKNIINQSQVVDSTKLDVQNIEKAADVVGTLTKDIQDAIASNDDDKLNQIKENLSQTIEEVENLLKDSKINVDLKEKLVDSIKNLQEVIGLDNIDNSIVEADFSKENIFTSLDELKNVDLKEIDITDKKSMDEIIKVLDNLDENLNNFEIDENVAKDIQNKIENLVKAIENQEISADELEQAIDTLADDIKVETTKQENTILAQENTIDISSQFEKFNNNQNSQNDTKNQPNFEQKQEVELGDNFEADVEIPEVNLKGKVAQNIDVKNVEENLQKQIFTQEILDEMMVEVEIPTTLAQSGSLSVADEVARLAMSETTSLNPVTSAHGSVTYDSFGVNAVIKNAASLMKAPATAPAETPLMEDVLNQVANKITQLKDGATQKLTMVLRPLDLGRLSIELTSNQQGLTTQIMAQNEDVRAYIERNIDSLRQQLSEAGVNVNSIQIKTAGSEGSTTYEGNQNFNRENQENLNQEQNSKDGKNHNPSNKEAKDFIASISNYDMHFAKDFSSVLNKSLNYNLN